MTIDNKQTANTSIGIIVYRKNGKHFEMRYSCPLCGMLTVRAAVLDAKELRCQNCDRLLNATRATVEMEED